MKFILFFLLSLSMASAFSAQTRKVAQVEVGESDLSKDLRGIRQHWLAIKSEEDLQLFLSELQKKNATLSADARLVATHLELLLPLRGIVWRMAPVFENKQNALRTKSALVLGVQIVRALLISVRMTIPTELSDSFFNFLTHPSGEMSLTSRFKTMDEVQDFLLQSYLPALEKATKQLEGLTEGNKTLAWDNQIIYGKPSFEGDLNRFVVFGPAEIYSLMGKLQQTKHDLLVFCSYNENYAVRLLNDFNLKFAIDSSMFVSKSKPLGMTDEERGDLIKKAMKAHDYLKIKPQGQNLMGQAFEALKTSVAYSEKAIQASSATAYPVFLRNGHSYTMDVELMKSLLEGPVELKDPVSGLAIKVNVPAFYLDAPKSFLPLLATKFSDGTNEVTIAAKDDQKLQARNYLLGSALAWDNEAWSKYVPSAEGKDASYMNETRRIFQHLRQLSMLFMVPEIIIH